MSKTAHPIRLVHVSDVHLGSGESHGRVNPETGLNSRFEDFVVAFSKSVDYALENSADIFLFSGDAYRNASPEPIYQKAFANQLRRLSESGIKTILLVGNHDQIFKSTSSHAMSVFQSLAVPNVITIDKPEMLRLDTAHGACQIIGLPHVTRHLLMAHEKYASLPASEIEKVMVKHVRDILRGFYDALDPALPAVATAHMMVDRARAGAEQELMVGYSMTFPLDLFVDRRLDYVALGHVHGYQVLHEEHPPIVYAGSIERVDFGEELEDKGFVDVKLCRGATSFNFQSINPRPFVTVDADLTACDDPTSVLTAKIKDKIVPGCIMRLRFQIESEKLSAVNEQALRNAAASAFSLLIRPELTRYERQVRLPELTESSVSTPLSALAKYLEELAPERKDALLARAEALCREAQEES